MEESLINSIMLFKYMKHSNENLMCINGNAARL